MFNLGGPEIMVILVLALVVLGPERLPGAGRQIGKALRDLRNMSSGVREELREALDVDELRNEVAGLRDAFDVRKIMADADAGDAGVGDAAAERERQRHTDTGSWMDLTAAAAPFDPFAVPAPDGGGEALVAVSGEPDPYASIPPPIDPSLAS